jgi:hypothetical protein
MHGDEFLRRLAAYDRSMLAVDDSLRKAAAIRRLGKGETARTFFPL